MSFPPTTALPLNSTCMCVQNVCKNILSKTYPDTYPYVYVHFTSTSWLTRPTHTFFLNILVVLHEVGRRAPDYRSTQVELAPTALREVSEWGLGIHGCVHTNNEIQQHTQTQRNRPTYENKFSKQIAINGVLLWGDRSFLLPSSGSFPEKIGNDFLMRLTSLYFLAAIYRCWHVLLEWTWHHTHTCTHTNMCRQIDKWIDR